MKEKEKQKGRIGGENITEKRDREIERGGGK